jgi:hypothetical protein
LRLVSAAILPPVSCMAGTTDMYTTTPGLLIKMGSCYLLAWAWFKPWSFWSLPPV